MTRHFASDNNAGIHPEVMAAIAAANHGHEPSYGDDSTTARLAARCVEVFGECVVFPVFSGTGANVTAVASVLRPHEHVISAQSAHINDDEGGATERFAGSKIIGLPTPDGKLTPELVQPFLHVEKDEHKTRPRVLSITQATEWGTTYSPAEVRALADLAHGAGLVLHVDGARIANAAAWLGCELAETTSACGVDMLSFGGTKNGGLVAEAVVFFDASLSSYSRYTRIQAMQLASKMRFISAQLLALLTDDLWRRNAQHANAMTARLAAAITGIAGVELVQPVQANELFVRLPLEHVPAIMQHARFSIWREHETVARFVSSWDTTPDDVDGLAGAIATALARS